MKTIKIGMMTLALGLFAASCGNNSTTEDTYATDTMSTYGTMDGTGGTGTTDMGTGTMTDTMGTYNDSLIR